MWSCITSEFTCDTMIPKHDFLYHVLLHCLKLTCEGFEDPIGVIMWRCSITLELTCHGFDIPANSFFEVALLVNLLVDHLNVSVKLHFRSCIT